MPFQSPTLSPTRRGSLLPAAIPILILAAVLITMPAAQAKSLKLSHDFGSVWRGTVQRESVRVTAPADQTVTIRKTRTSCGCLRIAQCPASIPAGTSADIVLALDTNTLEGKVSFTAYIETDVAKMRLIKVKTLANVTSLLRVTPPAIDFGTNTWGSTVSPRRVKLEQTTGVHPRILTVSTDHPALQASLLERPSDLSPNQPISLEAKLGNDCPAGKFRARIILRLDSPQQPTIGIPVTGTVLGPINTTPEIIDFGTVSRAGASPGRQVLRLKGRPGAPTYRVKRLEATPNGFLTATLTEDVPGESYTVALELRRIPPWPTLEGKLTLHTDAPGQARIVIPVQGRFED